MRKSRLSQYKHEHFIANTTAICSAEGKFPVFELLMRGERVYTKIIPHAKSGTLIPIIEKKAIPDSIVYNDSFKSYNALDISGTKPRNIWGNLMAPQKIILSYI